MTRHSRTLISRTVRSILVLVLAVVAAIPLYYVLVSSFKTSLDMNVNPLGLPTSWNFENYSNAFTNGGLLSGFKNSLVLTVLGVALQVLIGSLASYGMVLSSNRFTVITGAVLLIAFAVPLQATLVPQYTMFAKAGLTNSLLGLILIYAGGSVFCYFLIVGYMRTVPKDLLEAARLDGAGAFRVYWAIVLPLCRPILTTVIVFQTMSIWNDFLLPNVYLASPQKRTVILQVFSASGVFATNWPLFMAVTVIALLPVFIFFVLCQRWIVSGLVAGSVKG